MCVSGCFLVAGLSAATTATIGSLPERFSWQPFHARNAAPFSPPHAGVSGSLDNFLTFEAPEHARNYFYAPQGNLMKSPPPPCIVCSSSGLTNFRPTHASSRSHGQPWEPLARSASQTLSRCVHPPLNSCYSQLRLAPQPLCGARCFTQPDNAEFDKVDLGRYDETTPLLANCPYVCPSFLLFVMAVYTLYLYFFY